MSSYQLVDGYDNAGTLATFSPQPASPGLLYPRYIKSVNGYLYPDGQPYTFWIYEGLITATQYDGLLTTFGLASVFYNEVTIKTMIDPDRATWNNYNAIIWRPRNGEESQWKKGFWRDVKFTLQLVEAL